MPINIIEFMGPNESKKIHSVEFSHQEDRLSSNQQSNVEPEIFRIRKASQSSG